MRYPALSEARFPFYISRAFFVLGPTHRRLSINHLPSLNNERAIGFGDKNALKVLKSSLKKSTELEEVLEENDQSHMVWWKERMKECRKSSTVQLSKRLTFTNLLGTDVKLKNGSLKEGSLNSERLQFKSKFPREVLLCRVGEFYEAVGIDACVLVEYAGLNPLGGVLSDSIPRAGCPVVNLHQTLNDLTRNGYSVCVVEEVQGPTHGRCRKGRFISGHARPGSPYIYGLAGVNYDLEFPDPIPIIGISRSSKGYCLTIVIESMKTFSAEDGLSEEALLTKLRSCCYHQLFLHISLRNNVSGTCRWGEFGEGGRLWAECSSRQFEWYHGNPVNDLLEKVKELLGFGKEMTFRNTMIFSEKRPCPLHLGTASQIGAIPTEGIPSLLKVLLPSNCTGLPLLYIRDLILNPPAYNIASNIQATCKLINEVACPVPEFTCFSSAKLVKLLELREVNHIEFYRIKNVADEVLHMYRSSELNAVLESLMGPTCVATGLKIDFKNLVYECECISNKIGEILCLKDDADQIINSHPPIPNEFFEDMESLWKGRVKQVHIKEAYNEVEKAAEALSFAVFVDFVPLLTKIKASTASPFGGAKGQISYSREHQSVWFRGRGISAMVLAGTAIDNQSKHLIHAVDSKGKRVGEEWFTTKKVEEALTRYHDAGAKAKADVLSSLRRLSAELEIKINILVFSSTLLVISKALFSHVSEGRRRKWVFPTLTEFCSSEDGKENRMNMSEMWPYWFDGAEGKAVYNTVDMRSLFILTGPNGGGKSSLLRSICAAALLGICGLMVPAKSAIIPHFDSIMLHMKSYDSPADSKSSFQTEMSEIRSVITRATRRSLVLIDEICRGTETEKGMCIAGSIVEALDHIGCMGVVSTHLHAVPALPLETRNAVLKAMGTCRVDGGGTKPTWKLEDGICRESLAFEMAAAEGIPEPVIARASALYNSLYGRPSPAPAPSADLRPARGGEAEVADLITGLCRGRLAELYEDIRAGPGPKCVLVGARELPPPSTVGASGVYVMFRPDEKLYVGQTDDLQGRIRGHRAVEGMKNNTFLYLTVPGKSVACQLETLIIHHLSALGFRLANVADGRHRNFAYLSSIC